MRALSYRSRVGLLVLALQSGACTQRHIGSTGETSAQATTEVEFGSTAGEPGTPTGGLASTALTVDPTTGLVGTAGSESTGVETTSGPGVSDCGEVMLASGRRFNCLNYTMIFGRQLAAADFSGDGIEDLAVLEFSEIPMDVDRVHMIFGGTSPTPGAGFPVDVPSATDGVLLAGDLDGDAAPDLVNAGYFSVHPLWNDGHGGFSDGASEPVVWLDKYTLADVGGLGRMALVGSMDDGEKPVIQVVGFDLERNFVVAPATAPVVTCYPEAIVAARLDADPFPDLVVAPYCDPPLDATPVHVYRGTETAEFELTEPGVLTGSAPGVLAAGDYDGDGDMDIVVGNQWIDNLMLLRGDGAGGFEPRPPIGMGALGTPNTLATGDLGAPADSIVMIVVDPNAPVNHVAVVREPLSDEPTIEVLRSDAIPYIGRGGLAVGDFNGDAADDIAYMLVDDTLVLLLSAP